MWACPPGADELPVDHQLPSQGDSRRFTASFNTSEGSFAPADVEYNGGGVYQIIVVIPTHGSYIVGLHLTGPKPIMQAIANATCSTGRVPIVGGRCGCKAGLFQLSKGQQCEPCAPSTSSADGALGGASCDGELQARPTSKSVPLHPDLK